MELDLETNFPYENDKLSKKTKLVRGCWVHFHFSFLRAIGKSRSLMTLEVETI